MIPLLALGWLRSNWKLLAILAALVFLVIAAWTVVGWYRAAQKLEAIQETAEEVEKLRQASEQEMNAKLAAEAERRAEAEQREAEARAQAQQMASLAQQLGIQLGAVGARQAQVRQEVAALPAEQLERRIQSDLGLRRPEDTRPGFYPEELRGIAHCTAEYPLCQQKSDLLEQRLTALEGQVGAQEKQIGALGDQLASERRSRAALEQGYTELKGHYITLYNSVGVKKRAPKCLYLWKCGTKTLPTPSPGDLGVTP